MEQPYCFSLLSLPRSAGSCNLLDCLVGDDFLGLSKVEEQLFLTEDELGCRVREQGRARCHWADPLRGDGEEYAKLIRDLAARSMLEYDFSCKESVGLFTVSKKSGKQRLIIDCRRLNQRMRVPPRTPLASSCAFGELSSAESGLYFASHDVADCFYNFRIPRAYPSIWA